MRKNPMQSSKGRKESSRLKRRPSFLQQGKGEIVRRQKLPLVKK